MNHVQRYLHYLVLPLLLSHLLSLNVAAQDDVYDLVLRNGRIIDGSGNPWFSGDVAILGDRIIAVGRIGDIRGKRAIDAAGLVIAPGFIDIHSHSDFVLLEDGDANSKIHQGVTTEVLGEGSSAGPLEGKLSPRQVTIGNSVEQWSTLGEYLDLIDRSGVATNVASYVGLNNAWQSVMGNSFDRPSDEQIQAMRKLVDRAMRDGAFGLSSQVMMPPGSLATTDDIVEIARAVVPYQGIYSTHIRNEGTGVFESVKEAIEIGERAGVAVDIIHLKIADQEYWGRMDEVVALIDAARERGVNVQANVYPYTRGNNNLVSIIPPWAHEGGRAKLLERLRDLEQRARLKHDIVNGVQGWYNHYTAVGGDWSRMLVSGNNRFKGLTMDRVMSLRTQGKSNADLLDELFDLLIEEQGSVSTVYAHHTEADMNLAMSQPWCSIGSDGSAYSIEGPLRRGNPHPRNFGTFPRVLGVYAREQNLLRLEKAVRKMTSMNAAKIGLHKRGSLAPGFFADVTVFDPKTVRDRAAYTDPFQYNDGIRYVIVNGTIVLDGGKHVGARPGRALRREQID
ncbi:MAG: D-aminoacylase [Planctomycetes bacterium]|nr:D-aminoacylase [Planctomycetota bacterium]